MTISELPHFCDHKLLQQPLFDYGQACCCHPMVEDRQEVGCTKCQLGAQTERLPKLDKKHTYKLATTIHKLTTKL